jgi:hypothetical protein
MAIPYPLDDSTTSSTWKIKGNAPRADMQEAARMVGVDVTVNCTYNGDRDLIGLHVGDLDDAWHEAVRFCYKMHSCKPPTNKADIVVVNAYPQTTQGADWWGAIDSLREGGSAVAIAKHPWASAIVHYLEERRSWRSSRLHGSPEGPWPVKQAERIIQYSDFLAMREKLQYSSKVEWVTSWSEVIDGLNRTHGDSANVVVFHDKLQFNPDNMQLII